MLYNICAYRIQQKILCSKWCTKKECVTITTAKFDPKKNTCGVEKEYKEDANLYLHAIKYKRLQVQLLRVWRYYRDQNE